MLDRWDRLPIPGSGHHPARPSRCCVSWPALGAPNADRFGDRLRRTRASRLIISLGLAWIAILALASVSRAETIVVASKNFEESRLLAEIFALVIEDATDLEVERTFDLAGTQICFEALRNGDDDLYPEYTGTGLVSILDLPSQTDPAAVLHQVRQEFSERWNLIWLAPLGFENAYEIGFRKDFAEEYGIRTISQLGRAFGEL